MHERGHFKWLKMNTWSYEHNWLCNIINDVECINNLIKLEIMCIDDTGLLQDAALPSAKILRVQSRITLEMVKLLAQCFPNLEKLQLKCESIRTIEEIVRSLPKLEIMDVDRIYGNVKFNIQTLNDARKKLLRSIGKLTINLHPEPYLKARWTSVNLYSDFVNIKRFTQHY